MPFEEHLLASCRPIVEQIVGVECKYLDFAYENFLMAKRETERNKEVAWQFVRDGCWRNRVYHIVHTSVENAALRLQGSCGTDNSVMRKTSHRVPSRNALDRKNLPGCTLC